MKKMKLDDLFYELGLDNIIFAKINEYIKLRGNVPPPPPELPWLRDWAEKTANRFYIERSN